MSHSTSHFRMNSTESIGLSFIKVYNKWHKLIKDKLKEVGLTHPQFVVLASLGYLSQINSEVNQKEISEKSDIDVMTVSTIIRNLEKLELLVRQDSQRDTRAKSVSLTTKGGLLLTQAVPLVESVDELFFNHLADDSELFNAFLHRLLEGNI